MKYKNILLVVFLLTLFVFEQVQAGPTIPSAKNLSQINSAPANTNILYTDVYVFIYILNPPSDPINPGAIKDPPTLCTWPDDDGKYGCGNTYPTYEGSTNSNRDSLSGFFRLNVEQDYLPNVLPNEMNFAEIPPTEAEALKAQAGAVIESTPSPIFLFCDCHISGGF